MQWSGHYGWAMLRVFDVLPGGSGQPLSDTEVFRTLLDALCEPGYADEFDAGYATGWIEALIQDRDLFALPLA